jgi:PilZ domain
MNEPAPPVVPDKIGRRANARVRLGIPGKLLLLGSNADCLIDNLSRSGARLSMPEPPGTGECAILQCDGLEAFCTVIRVEARACAVAFTPPLDQRNVCAMRTLADHYAEHLRTRIEGRARDWISGTSRTF